MLGPKDPVGMMGKELEGEGRCRIPVGLEGLEGEGEWKGEFPGVVAGVWAVFWAMKDQGVGEKPAVGG